MQVIVAGAALFATNFALDKIEYAKDMEYIETKRDQIHNVMKKNKNNTKIQYQGYKAVKKLRQLGISRSIDQTKEMIKKVANPLDKAKPRLLKRIKNFLKELFDDESETLRDKADEIGDDFEDETGKFLEGDTETGESFDEKEHNIMFFLVERLEKLL